MSSLHVLLLQRETFLSCSATECVGVLELQYPQYNTIMSEKKSKGGKSKAKNNRRWTDLELDCFADVLVDPENSFKASVDTLALKKSSNNEVYECIQKELVMEMQTEDFKQKNAEYFVGKPTKLDTSVEKFRVKYKWFKTEWARNTYRKRACVGSKNMLIRLGGLALESSNPTHTPFRTQPYNPFLCHF